MKTLNPSANPVIDLSIEDWPERGPLGNDGDNLTIEALESAVQKLLDSVAVLSQLSTTLAAQLADALNRIGALDFPTRYAEYIGVAQAPVNPQVNVASFFTSFRRLKPYSFGTGTAYDDAGPILLRPNSLYMIQVAAITATSFGNRSIGLGTYTPQGYTDPSPPPSGNYYDPLGIGDNINNLQTVLTPGQQIFAPPTITWLNGPHRGDGLRLFLTSNDIRDYVALQSAVVRVVHLANVPIEVPPGISN